jgi:hypothetical protein
VATEGNAAGQPAASPANDDHSGPPTPPGGAPGSRRSARRAQFRRLVRAIRDSDLEAADVAVLRLSRSRRWLAPLALAVGAFATLFVGVKLLFTNWRLTLIQVLPAMWTWAAMVDLKAHVLHGKTFHELAGPVVIPIVVAIAAITAVSFYLNAVFAYAIAGPGPPLIRPAFSQTRSHLAVVLGSGAAVGLLLGVSTVVVVRWGVFWFGLSLSIIVGLMMVCYVAVPARLIGMKTTYTKRDKLAATAVGGAIGAIVCTPPYVLGRLGLLMLGSNTLFALGVVVFAAGLMLQAGATGAVKTVKMSAKLVAGSQLHGGQRKPDSSAHVDNLSTWAEAPPLREAVPGSVYHAAITGTLGSVQAACPVLPHPCGVVPARAGARNVRMQRRKGRRAQRPPGCPPRVRLMPAPGEEWARRLPWPR